MINKFLMVILVSAGLTAQADQSNCAKYVNLLTGILFEVHVYQPAAVAFCMARLGSDNRLMVEDKYEIQYYHETRT